MLNKNVGLLLLNNNSLNNRSYQIDDMLDQTKRIYLSKLWDKLDSRIITYLKFQEGFYETKHRHINIPLTFESKNE